MQGLALKLFISLSRFILIIVMMLPPCLTPSDAIGAKITKSRPTAQQSNKERAVPQKKIKGRNRGNKNEFSAIPSNKGSQVKKTTKKGKEKELTDIQDTQKERRKRRNYQKNEEEIEIPSDDPACKKLKQRYGKIKIICDGEKKNRKPREQKER